MNTLADSGSCHSLFFLSPFTLIGQIENNEEGTQSRLPGSIKMSVWLYQCNRQS